jgi:large subunit ribosomal protein L10
MMGTVGAAFSYEDGIAGPRLIKKLSKDFEKLQLLGGIMDGKVMSVAQMKEIAGLPSKQELLAKFAPSTLQGFYELSTFGIFICCQQY